MKVILKDAVYVPVKALKQKHVDKFVDDYMYRFYDERGCRTCEHKPDRHTDTCDTCPAYLSGVQLGSVVKENEKKYVKLPHGDRKEVIRRLEKYGYDFDVVRKYPKDTEIKPFKFTGQLRDYQKEAVEAVYKKRFGMLIAPARSGKTVTGTALIAKIGLKTIILASQRDWLVGFYETFVGSATQDPLTNIKKKRIGFAKKYKDFKQYDICLVTVQTFHSEKGRKLLEKIKDMFGVAILDEADTSPATQYARAIAKLNVKYFVALTATPDRKDGKWVIAEKLIGPILHEVKIERLQPTIRLVDTAYSPKLGPRVNWTNMVTKMEQDPARLKLIAQWALKDVENGHMVMIPLCRVTAIKALVGTINKMAGKVIAASFYGGTPKKQRDELIQQARKYKVKVLVGQARVMTRGVNIPRASALYEVTPSANLPQANQRFSRILTPFDGKPIPIIRYFMDPFDIRRACIKKEWIGEMLPTFKPIISDKALARFGKYMSTYKRPRYPSSDSGFDAPGWEH